MAHQHTLQKTTLNVSSGESSASQPRRSNRSLGIPVLIFLAGWLSACSPGFQSSSAISNLPSTTSGGVSDPSNGGAGPVPSWEAVEIDGGISNSIIGSHKVIELDRTTKEIVIRLPFFAGIPLLSTPALPVPGVPGASSRLEVDGSTTYWVIRLPVATWLKGISTLPRGRLPNGDKLPSIPNGELPSTGLALDRGGQIKGSLYLGPSVIAVFVATRFDPVLGWEVPIRNSSRTRTYGHLAAIPAKAGFNGGFFVALALPADLARAIDDLL